MYSRHCNDDRVSAKDLMSCQHCATEKFLLQTRTMQLVLIKRQQLCERHTNKTPSLPMGTKVLLFNWPLKGNTQFVMTEKKKISNCLDAQLESPSLTSDWHSTTPAGRTEVVLVQCKV